MKQQKHHSADFTKCQEKRKARKPREEEMVGEREEMGDGDGERSDMSKERKDRREKEDRETGGRGRKGMTGTYIPFCCVTGVTSPLQKLVRPIFVSI